MGRRIIEALYYKRKMTVQQIADAFGMSSSTVSDYLEYGSPQGKPEISAPLPHVGPPSDRLYRQGTCRACQIPLFGGDPKPREWCGEHDPRGRLL